MLPPVGRFFLSLCYPTGYTQFQLVIQLALQLACGRVLFVLYQLVLVL
jgi:hypothetical protein